MQHADWGNQPQALLGEAEAAARPAVLRGLMATWPAVALWAGSAGLQHIRQRAGDAVVQAMYSSTGDQFFGNIEAHQPVTCTLGELLDRASAAATTVLSPSSAAIAAAAPAAAPAWTEASAEASATSPKADAPAAPGPAAAPHLYLAQQSLSEPALGALLQDADVPGVLQGRQLDHTNLWLSIRATRSSIHYDPFHNLLCVVRGRKRIRLYSPEACAALYPRPVYGDSSNHSSVDFAAPDEQKHPLYRWAAAQALHVTLEAGDALFIPEGWWHQADSTDLTIAINYWWRSETSSLLLAQPHLHHYFIRQLLASITTQGVQQLQQALAPTPQPELQPKSPSSGTVATRAAPSEAVTDTGAGSAGSGPPCKRRRLQQPDAEAQQYNRAQQYNAAQQCNGTHMQQASLLDTHPWVRAPRTSRTSELDVQAAVQCLLQHLQHSEAHGRAQHVQGNEQLAGAREMQGSTMDDSGHHAARSHTQQQAPGLALQVNGSAGTGTSGCRSACDPMIAGAATAGAAAATISGSAAAASTAADAAVESCLLCDEAWHVRQQHYQQQLVLASMTPQAVASSTATAPSATATTAATKAATLSHTATTPTATTTTAVAIGARYMSGNGATAEIVTSVAPLSVPSDPLGLLSPITHTFAALSAQQLCDVLLLMARQHPAALRTLMLRELPPAAAQLLTGKLEEADADADAAQATATAVAEAAAAAATGGVAPACPPDGHGECPGERPAATAARTEAGAALASNAAEQPAQRPTDTHLAAGAPRDEFYAALWGAVGQPEEAMSVLLQGRAGVARAVFKATIAQQLLVD